MLLNIESSAKRGADLVGQVLTFAKGVESRRLKVDARQLLEETAKIANETFFKNIQVECSPAPDLWRVTGDPTQLNQVLLNLSVNARDAMPNGGRLRLSAENVVLDDSFAAAQPGGSPGPHVCITVDDSGIGMPAEVMDRIFEPFFTTKEPGKGTGLGLSTTLAIINSHKGFVQVRSQPGRGTTFHVYLPAQMGDATAGGDAAGQGGASAGPLPRGGGELVLVVDDETVVRDTTSITLETGGYRVLTAEDGAGAVALSARLHEEVDVVLTDMMMPGMDGPATIKELLRINPRARIIAASGVRDRRLVASVCALGVSHFLAKPYSAESLLGVVSEALGRCSPP
jgi:two-component system cell cycle sensor histidine kinase/response regulator CckA